MKTFVLGVLVGAVVCFSIIQLTQSDVARSAAPDRLIADPATRSPTPEINSATSAAPVRTRADNAEKRLNPQPPESDKAPAAAPTSMPADERKDWVERMTEQEATEVCRRADQLRQSREQAAKDAEPKDAGWAYSMEQLMRQYVEMNLPADKYTKLQLECRTTFCTLHMEGKGTGGQEMAEKVVQQIQHQDWSDVVQKGSGSGSQGESWHIDYDWFRPRTEAERRMWFWNRSQQREQQH